MMPPGFSTVQLIDAAGTNQDRAYHHERSLCCRPYRLHRLGGNWNVIHFLLQPISCPNGTSVISNRGIEHKLDGRV